MTPETASTWTATLVMERVLRAYSAGQSLLLLFDFDGTLAEHAERPDLAGLTPVARAALQRLADQPRVHVGIVSGRAMAELIPLVGLERLLLAGTCGLELCLDGTVMPPPDSVNLRSIVREAADWLRGRIDGAAGAWIEEKPFALTMHLAKTDVHGRVRIRKWLNDEFISSFRIFRTIDCALGVEILPDNGLSKATAIRRILDHIRPDSCFVMFAGNDTNDEDALALAVEMGGLAIGIGPTAPQTEHCFPDPEQFVRFLSALAGRLS